MVSKEKGSIGKSILLYVGMEEAIKKAYKEAIEPERPKSDYEKYLLPTLNTTRPDPALVSYIEKGFIPFNKG